MGKTQTHTEEVYPERNAGRPTAAAPTTTAQKEETIMDGTITTQTNRPHELSGARIAVGLAAVLCLRVLANCSATTATAGAETQAAAGTPVVWARTVPAQSLHPEFEGTDYSPRIDCSVKEDGLQLHAYWEPELVAVTVNRSPWAGYCDVVLEVDVTKRSDHTRQHEVLRRTVWFEIGQERPLLFALPPQYEVNNARVHTQ